MGHTGHFDSILSRLPYGRAPPARPAIDRPSSSSSSDAASFRTASQGPSPPASHRAHAPPRVRLQTPSGRSQTPSIPSTRAFSSSSAASTSRSPPPLPAPVPFTSANPPAAPVRPALTPTAAPAAVAGGLAERLKKQRAEKLAEQQAGAAATAGDVSQLPPAAMGRDGPPPSSPHPSRLSSPRSLPPSVNAGGVRDLGRSWDAGPAEKDEYRMEDDQWTEWGGGGWERGGDDYAHQPHNDSGLAFHPDPNFHHPPFPSSHHPNPYPAAAVDQASPHPPTVLNDGPLVQDDFDQFSPDFRSHPSLFNTPHYPTPPLFEMPSRASPFNEPSSILPPSQVAPGHPPYAQTGFSPDPRPLDGTLLPASQEGASLADDMVPETKASRERRERLAMLEWERRRREAERGTASPDDWVLDDGAISLSSGKGAAKAAQAPVARSFVSSRSSTSRREEALSASSRSSHSTGRVLTEGWLFFPPPVTSSSKRLLRDPASWIPQHVILTSRDLKTVPTTPDEPSQLLCQVSEVMSVRPLTEQKLDDFHPFRIELKDGRRIMCAGQDSLDAGRWILTFENARTNAYRQSLPSIFSPSGSSSRTSVSTIPSSPPPLDEQAHLANLDRIIDTLDDETSKIWSQDPTTLGRKVREGKNEEWMSNFDRDVPTYAFLEELHPDAPADDWGAHGEFDQPPSSGPLFPLAHSRSSWPDRPPAASPPPPADVPLHHSRSHSTAASSRARARLRPADVHALEAILKGLKVRSAAVEERLAKRGQRVEATSFELEKMKESVEARRNRDGVLEKEDQVLLDRLDWLLHLNFIRSRDSQRTVYPAEDDQSTQRPAVIEAEELQNEIQARIAEMLEESREAERMREGLADDATRTPLLRYTASRKHLQHADGAFFSPVPFARHDGPPPSFDAPSFAAGPYSEKQYSGWTSTGLGPRVTATRATPTSKFSANTSEETPPHLPPPADSPFVPPPSTASWQYRRPTQNYGEPGQPLPYPPSSPNQPLEQTQPRWTVDEPPYSVEKAVANVRVEEQQRIWEKERRQWETEKAKWLLQVFARIEEHLQRQEHRAAVQSESQRRAEQTLKEVLRAFKHSRSRSSQDLTALTAHVDALGASLNALPADLAAALSAPPLPPPSLDQRAPWSARKLRYVPGNGRIGPLVVPAEVVPRGAPVGDGQTVVFGVDDPIPPPHHTFRMEHGASGAKAAKEVAALASSAVTLGREGERGGGGRLKAEEHRLLEEVAANPDVERALREWEGRQLAGGEKLMLDPASKAFAIYEILTATREIAREKAAVSSGRGAGSRAPLRPARKPSRPVLATNDTAAIVSRLLTSNQPPDKVLSSLGALLHNRKRGYVGEKETGSKVAGLLRKAFPDLSRERGGP